MLLEGREILASGNWPGSLTISFDDEDLQGIVDSFNALKLGGRLPLKLGHDGPDVRYDENPLRQFALGWVKRIWRAGSRILADFDVPTKVYDAIQEGYLKFVSVELKRDVEVHNRQIPWVLDAVALLGTDQPAVGILKDLQALTFRVKPSLRRGASVTLSMNRSTTNEEPEMDKSEVQKAVAEAVALAAKPLLERIETAEKSAKEANERAEKADKEKKTNEIKLKREQIDELFNAAIEAGGIEPKVRESYIRLTRYDKKDEAVEEITMKEVKEFIDENTDKVNLAAKKKEKDKATTQTGAKDEDADKPADIRLANAVKKACLARGKDPSDAKVAMGVTLEILRENKELAKAYQQQIAPEAANEGGK